MARQTKNPLTDPLASVRLDNPRETPEEPVEEPEVVVVEEPVEKPSAVVVPPPAPPPVKIRRFEVLRQTTISWGQQFITLRAGDVVTHESHDDIQRLIDAGVPLREIE
jgi:hypothetical protein